MENEKSKRRVSSLMISALIIFSALAVMNFVSTNVRAETHDTDWYIEGHQWRNNTTITLDHCNLQINDSATLTFNYNVTLEIICTDAGDQGIKINSTGKFEINSPSADVFIISGSTPVERTYYFTNSGTLDFLGATVERVYGPSNTALSGGIVNNPGSICKLTNCYLNDSDTHSICVESDDTYSTELTISQLTIDQSTSSTLSGTGVWVKNNSNVEIQNLIVRKCKQYGIKCENADNVTIKYCDINNNTEHGIFIDNSSPIIEWNKIPYNVGSGIYCQDSANVNINNNTISSSGQISKFGDSMETGVNNVNWNSTGLWHPITKYGEQSWNISQEGDWSWWFGLDETGSYDTTVNYSHFSYNSTSETFYHRDADYHVAYISIFKDADITSSSLRIEGDYESLYGSDMMETNNFYNIYVTSNCTWAGDVSDTALTVGWNYLKNYSAVWSYSQAVSSAMADVPYTQVNQGPTNLTFDIGDDGDYEWSHAEEYTDSEIIDDTTTGGDFSQEIQDYIDAHSPDEWGYFHVPINITSSSFGIVSLSELEIIGEYEQFSGNMISKSIDLSGLSTAYLMFWSWYEANDSADFRNVTVRNSIDETTYTVPAGSMNEWSFVSFNISDYVGSQINVTFSFDTADDINNTYQGWYIDSVHVAPFSPFYPGCGIDFTEVTSSHIDDNTISNSKYEGIGIYRSNYNNISGNTLTTNDGNGGIYLYDFSLSNTIKSNQISSNPANGILLEKYSRQNKLQENIISGITGTNSCGINAISFSDWNEISHNNITSCVWGIQALQYSSNNIIDNNTITDSFNGINLTRSGGNFIHNNSHKGDCGLVLNELSMGNDIYGNVFTDEDIYGAHLTTGSSDNKIYYNILNNNNMGIFMEFSLNNEISFNEIDTNNYGVYCVDSSGSISNNTIDNNYNTGIHCQASAMNIYDNPSISYNQEGIYIVDTPYAEVARNIVTHNGGSGINVSNSEPKIYDNENISSNRFAGINVEDSGDYIETCVFGYDGTDDTVTFYEYGDALGHKFYKEGNNMINIPNNTEPGWDTLGSVHPDMLYFENGCDGYKYWMYYTPYSDESLEADLVENMCLVRSNDGVNFTEAGVANPLIVTEKETSTKWFNPTIHYADEDVIKVNDTTWFMYYVGDSWYNYGDRKKISEIGLATSTDGIHWAPYANNPVLSPQNNGWEWNDIRPGISCPTVIYNPNSTLPNETYIMWYTAWTDYSNIIFNICRATSEDGITWFKRGPVVGLEPTDGRWDYHQMTHMDVNYRDELYKMYYVANNYENTLVYRLGVALSENGTWWERYDTPLTIDEDSTGNTYRSSPVIIDGKMKLYYTTIAYPDNISLASDSFPSVILPKGATVTNASMKLTGTETGGVYPSNVKLDIGDDGNAEWQHDGDFDDVHIIGDLNASFSEAIQSYLDNTDTDNGSVQVPFVISSDTAGKVTFSELSVSWHYGVEINHNTISSNDWGIILNGSSYNIITDNDITLNSHYGAYLNNTTHDNSIYHNNFIDNCLEYPATGPQAYDNGTSNDWDDGYPSGGNYWSDYNETDSYGGPSQNLSGSDGIGDTHYDIDNDLVGISEPQDRYPMMYENRDTYTYWAKTYGDSYTENLYWRGIHQTSDGGYVVAGYTNSDGAGYDDFWILKLEDDGNVTWQKTYGGTGNEEANAIIQTDDDSDGQKDDGYIVVGYTYTYGTSGSADMWVIKLNEWGNITWDYTYGGIYADSANSIIQTSDGGYIVAGYTVSAGSGSADYWVIKLNSDGTVSWDRTFGGSSGDYADSVIQTSDGNYTVGGFSYSYRTGTSGADYWVLHIESDGDIIWNKTYGFSNSDDALNSIMQTSDGGYIACGYTYTGGDADYWVLKLESDGDITWQYRYGGDYDDCAVMIDATSDGGFVIAGYTKSYGFDVGSSYDCWLLKLYSNGTINWQKTYGGDCDDYAWSVEETSNGGVIVAGYTNSNFSYNGDDCWILKLGPNGGITFDEDSYAYTSNTDATAQSTSCSVSTPSTGVKASLDTKGTTSGQSEETDCIVGTQATPSYGWYRKDGLV
jgi:parallel beta-helix repeat protein